MKVLKQIENIILYLLIFLVPIFVLPIFPAVYITPKLLLLTWGLCIILVLKAIRILVTKELRFSNSTFDLPVLFLGLAFVLGLVTHSQYLMDALVVPGTATAILGGIVLYFVINQLDKKKKAIKYPLLLSGVVVSFVSILSVAGILRSLTGLPEFVRTTNFSLLETTLPTLVFLASLLALGISTTIREKDIASKTLFGIISGMLVLGVIISAYFALPSKMTVAQYPNLVTSWAVSADSLKENPLLGVGPGNFQIAFNRFRPISFNATPDWTNRYIASGSFILTVVSEAGLLGLAAIIFIAIKYFYLVRSKKFTPAVLSLGILGLLLIVFPASTGVITLIFILLALASRTKSSRVAIPVILVAVPVFIFVPIFLFLSGKLALAEFTYRQALSAVIANDGRRAYEQTQQAIILNPYMDRYRTTYAQINLALANTIAAGENLTDEQKQTVSQLIQQAIQEGKAGVTLAPYKAANWEVLAGVYKSIIPLAKGADQFSLQTISQAINLDPMNPNYRIALGGIYYQLKDYDSAIDAFKLAIATKPDLANAHYNLAIAYREKGDIERAIAEINNVLALVSKDSKDYELAQQELQSLESKRPAEETTQPQPEGGETLDAPDQAPDATPSATLPPDAQPPAPQTTPEPENP